MKDFITGAEITPQYAIGDKVEIEIYDGERHKAIVRDYSFHPMFRTESTPIDSVRLVYCCEGEIITDTTDDYINKLLEPAPYKAVTRDELVNLLGRQCSPMASKKGYVIGKDITGRLAHCASCSTLSEASILAAKYNRSRSCTF